MKDKIIVVEDNIELSDLLGTLLTHEGYQVKSLLDAANLKNVIDDYQPDLLLMDLWIEPVNANEIIEEMRQESKFKDLPIILVSAADNLEEICLECGANCFVKKPFDFGYLVSRIEKCLGDKPDKATY
ncbi:MAG: response regulator [Candidatus Pacebacteria bacterium]|nr:response regulator [Candidatus Paceibacterota bacterium]